jgi:hypothetical protein
MFCLPSIAQDQPSVTVPHLVKFSGALVDGDNKTLTGLVGVTFSLYKHEQGGAPLWVETQNVSPDRLGYYTVTLGSTTSQGLPTDLFASGEARWLGVQAEGQLEQPRVLLMSVPYALKAGDAETVGGLPPSAFVLAAPSGSGSQSSSNALASSLSNLGGPHVDGGTQNFIPLWTDNNGTLGNSALFQGGTANKRRSGLAR